MQQLVVMPSYLLLWNVAPELFAFGHAGVPIAVSEPSSPAAQAFMAAAERTAAQVSIASYSRPIVPPTIPLTVVR